MSRLVAWVVLVGAATLIYSLAFTSYEHDTGSWQSTESGGLIPVTVTCPAPFRVLLMDDGPEDDPDSDECVRSSRTLVLEAGFVALAAGLIVWKPITRPRPTRIEPISKKIGTTDSDPG